MAWTPRQVLTHAGADYYFALVAMATPLGPGVVGLSDPASSRTQGGGGSKKCGSVD